MARASLPAREDQRSFKLFLGYAPGVGKTYAMLSEGIRRRSRGEDVVIGIVETHGRKGIAELAPQLETVPAGRSNIRARLSKRWTWTPSSPAARRWSWWTNWRTPIFPAASTASATKTCRRSSAAKIDVLSTLNIQHMESIAPTVHSITGITVRETVPDWVPLMANETVMVDLTPEALQNRLRRGDVYSPEKVDQALKNFFRGGNLIALRELALRQVAEHVDRSLESYMGDQGDRGELGRARAAGGLHQLQSGGAIPDRARRAHGAAAGCGVLRHPRGYRRRLQPRTAKVARGQCAVRRRLERQGHPNQRAKYRRRRRRQL